MTCLLFTFCCQLIQDQKKIIKSQKSKNIGEIVKSQLKEEYVIENIVVSQTTIEEDTSVDIIVKLNLNINVKIKHKTRVIQNMCRGAFVNGWVPNLANLSETRTLCKLFSTDLMFSVIYFIFVLTDRLTGK